jgi:outer membrane protein assembly factor BamB
LTHLGAANPFGCAFSNRYNMKYSIYFFLLAAVAFECKKEPFQTGAGKVTAEILWQEKLPGGAGYGDKTTLSQTGSIFYTKIFGGPNDVVACRDGLTGKVNYTWQDPIDIYDGEKISMLECYRDALVVGSYHEFNVLDARTGNRIWKTDAQTQGGTGSNRSAIIDEYIYHTRSITNDRNAYLVKTHYLSGRWDTLFSIFPHKAYVRFSVSNWGVWQHPITRDSILLFGVINSNNGATINQVDFVAFNMTKRKVEWQVEDFEPNGYCATQAPTLVAGNKAYFLGAVTLFCFDLLTGKIAWTKTYNNQGQVAIAEHLQFTTPIIAQNMLIIKPLSRRMFAYDLETGAEKWAITNGGQDAWDVQEYKGYLFMPSYQEGDIWVHRVSDGAFVTKIVAPGDVKITQQIEIDQDKGLLYTTNDGSSMCFKLKVE